jgi:hypothetical protein
MGTSHTLLTKARLNPEHCTVARGPALSVAKLTELEFFHAKGLKSQNFRAN